MAGTSWSPRRPVLLAAALTALPLALYTAYMAWLATGEGERARTAPELPAEPGEGRVHGGTFRVTGPVTAGLLTPPGWPEAAGAVAYRVVREVQSADGTWRVDAAAATEAAVSSALVVRDVPVQPGRRARLALAERTAVRPMSEGVRLRLTARVPEGRDLVVFGTYQHGRLQDGTYDRLIVTDPSHLEELMTAVAAEGRIKAWVLAAMGVFAGALAGLALYGASRRPGARPT